MAAMTPWQNRVGQASNMQALAFSRHLGKCCSRKKAKNEKSGRLFSGLLKLHFLVVDQRRLMYFSVDIIISAGPLGQTKAERFDRSNTHKMTLFHGAQLVTKAAAVAPLRNTRTWSVTKSSSGLSRRTLRLSSALRRSGAPCWTRSRPLLKRSGWSGSKSTTGFEQKWKTWSGFSTGGPEFGVTAAASKARARPISSAIAEARATRGKVEARHQWTVRHLLHLHRHLHVQAQLLRQCTHSWNSSSTSARFGARATTGMP